MMMLKCKMCGGDVVVAVGLSCGTCDHCGSAMTLPRVSDERQANLFNRANHFRRLNEFDKAMAAYENILNEDATDSEAHWGVVLSRYGIEYVEDPRTHERLPTCHRVQADSILRDGDYLQALEHAPDSSAKELYQRQAAAIAEIQKGILALSSQEEPFDVFICYKETSDGGSRTADSVLAQDLYHQLTQEKYRVFFSRITLENRLGQAYEPYIFAAINSAKVMVVLGTKPEHFTAVWVKNEWSRFLSLHKKDSRKLLIPCYRDMNPFSLPEELSALQSQDMGKIGFLQDLVRGIKKTLEVVQPTAGLAVSVVAGEVTPLMKRARIFLEDGDFQSADEYAERVLDKDPECAEAYLVKLLAQLKLKLEEELENGLQPLTENSLYQKACRYSQGAMKQRLTDYNSKRLEAAEAKIKAAERTQQAAREREERRQQQDLEKKQSKQRERERQKNLLAPVVEQLNRGEFDSAADALAALERDSVDCRELNIRLSNLRKDLAMLEAAVGSAGAYLASCGTEVAGFYFVPIGLRSRCRRAERDATTAIENCHSYLEKYPVHRTRFGSSIDNLKCKLDEFKASALPRILSSERRIWAVKIWTVGLVMACIAAGVVLVQVQAAATKAAASVEKAAVEKAAKQAAAELAEQQAAAQNAAVEKAAKQAAAELAEQQAAAQNAAVERAAKQAAADKAAAATPPVANITIGMELIEIPAGKFTMGSPAGEKDRGDNEEQVAVALTKPFWLGKTEVTQGQFKKVMGTEPWVNHGEVQIGENNAASYVSWNDATAFCQKLTDLERKARKLKANEEYRLPTEAQWEYACRAGTKKAYSFGDDETQLGQYAWFDGNTAGEKYAHKVGLKKPNPWGLYDMHGNVWEWCSDCYGNALPGGTDPVGPGGGSIRVLRGGSWRYDPDYCRSADRSIYVPSLRDYGLGFRVARSQSAQ